MPTAIAYDKSNDSILPIQVDALIGYGEHDVKEILTEQPHLVLFVPVTKDRKSHSHYRYHISGKRLKTRICCLNDVPARVRAAFLLAN